MRIRTYSSRNARNGGYTRNGFSGIIQEFRVVRDNRGNQTTSRELNSVSNPSSAPANDQVVSNLSGKSSMESLIDRGGQKSFQNLNGPSDSGSRHAHVASSNGIHRKELLVETEETIPNSDCQVLGLNAHDSQRYSATTLASNNSIVSLYPSSSDPVHVPSDSRSSAKIGAIKREVGVVGVRRPHSGNARKGTSNSSRPSTASKKVAQSSQTAVPDSVMPSLPTSRSFSSNQYSNTSHQITNHQKANKEWRPKSSKKSSLMSHGVTGTDTNPISSPEENSLNSNIAVRNLQKNFSKLNFFENRHVIIPEHFQVPEAERALLTFGSFGSEFDSTKNYAYGPQAHDSAEQSSREPCLSVSAPPASNADVSCVNKLDLTNDQVKTSRSDSPVSAASLEHPSPKKEESSSVQDLEKYADFALVQNNVPSHSPEGIQQQQNPSLLSNFPAFDPQPCYDVPFFRPVMDDTFRGQRLPSPQEVASSHGANIIPTSTVAMIQQPPVGQLYPQFHLSQFPNFLPYRQFLSPVFVPPMAVPGYSRNPSYSHPSNGSNYLLMPGCSSHMAAGGLKCGASQYKPIPSSSPTGFCTYTNSAGYAINAQGTVGGAISFEDSTGMKYKDGYIPNGQMDTSEFWIQTPREIPGLQSASYYISGQSPNAAYMSSQTGHASFDVAVTQSTQMQFSGIYHQPQPAPLANPHALVPGMAGNVGVGVASAGPGAQAGAYPQSQINHLNWSTNF